MILTALGILTIILIASLVIIIWNVYHMRGALGQVREVLDIIKNKPNLSGLLEAGKATQEIIQSPVPTSTS